MFLKFNNNFYLKLLSIFIIIQPILDIFTSLTVRHLNVSITIGIAVRSLFLLISFLYIVFTDKSKFKNYILIYLTALFVVIGISNILNFFSKPNFIIFDELQFTVKTVYFSVMFCALLLAIQNSINFDTFKNTMYKLITIAMSIFTITFFISILTNTSYPTYIYQKGGFSGWFYAGNEISAIVAISFPLVFYYYLKNTQSIKEVSHWLPVLLLAMTGIFIGTKVSFFAILITLTLVVFFILILWLFKIKGSGVKNTYTKYLLLSVIFAAFFALLAPFSPGYNNLQVDYSSVNEETDENAAQDDRIDKNDTEQTQKKEDGIIKFIMESRLANTILSSRNIYFENILIDYSEAKIPQKLFGLGYAGYYEDKSKMIEMDFFDLFFSYGIIGSILLLLPFFIAVINIFEKLIGGAKSFFTIENISLLLSVGLGLGIAFIAGHVLFAPAVSLYLVITLILLIRNTSRSKHCNY